METQNEPTHTPLVSVILPVYNGEKYLAQAMQSLLGQSFTDFELIVINDCSTDATEEVIRSFSDPRIVYSKNERNMHLIYSLNKGLGLAKGKYIARMDHDDIALPDRLKKQVEFLEAHPEVMVLGTLIERFSDEGHSFQPKLPIEPDDMAVSLLFFNPISHPSAMFRSWPVKEHGLQYNPNIFNAEDYALWWDMRQFGEIANHPEVLLRYREHPNQITVAQADTVSSGHRNALAHFFADMGLETVSEAQLNGWFALCLGKRANELLTCLSFLELIAQANAKSRKLPVDALNQQLQKMWRNLLLEATPQAGIWKAFKASDWSKLALLSPKQQLRLWVKATLKC
jgi:glycosyltransferase involved in cell wall biosynthesis